MNQEEMKKEFQALYDKMANSNEVAFMRTFGNVHKEMMEWFIANKPELAQEWLDKLESIKWKNYLTPKEAERTVDEMLPKAPWSREQWKQAMEQHGFVLEEEPYYNPGALFALMSRLHSYSSGTLKDYIGDGDMFAVIHALALDKLKDKDGKFKVREYFGV